MVRGLRILRYVVISLVLVAVVYKLSTRSVAYSSLRYSTFRSGSSRGDDTSSSEGAQQGEELPQPPKHDQIASLETDIATSNQPQRENATFVTLVRNEDLWEIVGSIRQVEDRFNNKYHYDWTFLNDKPFTDEFVRVTSSFVSGRTHYAQIDQPMWTYPDFIDQSKAAQTREDMKGIIYGWSESYRHMCRFESHFADVPILNQFKYYWRVEPHIKLSCDIVEDPFRVMREQKKRYGFTISLYEYGDTIASLWPTVQEWISKNEHYVHPNNAMEFISDDGGQNYNLCHFWSNFEIGDLDFWRSDAYRSFFNHLDHAGGFYYERWGDAPVHSLAAALMLDKNEIHYFEDIGYWHVPFQSCPTDPARRMELRCTCPGDPSLEADQRNIFTFSGYSCTPRWYKMLGKSLPKGWDKQ